LETRNSGDGIHKFLIQLWVLSYFAFAPSVSLRAFARDDRFGRTIFTQRRKKKTEARQKRQMDITPTPCLTLSLR
jgi:hypothetical protein